MRRRLALPFALPFAALAAAAVVSAGSGSATALGGQSAAALLTVDRGGAAIMLPDGSAREELPWLLPGDRDLAVSPGGRFLAFASARDGNGEIYVADAQTGALRRLTRSPGRQDAMPAWSPRGDRIAWASRRTGARGHDLFVMNAQGGEKRLLAGGPGDDVEPDWAPDGRSIAFSSDRSGRYTLFSVPHTGGTPTQLLDTPGLARGPSWHPSGGRIAYTGIVGRQADIWVAAAGGTSQRRLIASPSFEGRPDWGPEGRSLAFVRAVAGRLRPHVATAHGRGVRRLQAIAGEVDAATVIAAIAPRADLLLPDLDQRAPADVVVHRVRKRTLLGFASAVDSVGRGPLVLRGTRRGDERTMRADQLLERRGGEALTRLEIGRLRYEPHPPHFHWHLEPFERYELRRAGDFALIGRDGKSGFCLVDRYGTARRPGIRAGPPRFLGDCGAGNPSARHVLEGSSVGYTDRYPAFFHGQDIDVTGLPAGLYVLVHRANPAGRIRELSYRNNAASVLLRLGRSTPRSLPSVTVLARCEHAENCARP